MDKPEPVNLWVKLSSAPSRAEGRISRNATPHVTLRALGQASPDRYFPNSDPQLAEFAVTIPSM